MKIHPVILAGGSGTRLWPLSRKSYPKQFSELLGKKSLFQQTASRVVTSSLLDFSKPMILTNSDFRFIINHQLNSLNVSPGPILIEPLAKNTAPPILAASIYHYNKDRESVLLVTPSDHTIQNTEKFHNSVSEGLEQVKKGRIVTFGVNPTRAETGYGYLEISNTVDGEVKKVRKFYEKPSSKRAKEMISTGKFLWNAGIFMFRSEDMIKAFQCHHKQLLEPVKQSIDRGKLDLNFFRLDPESWSQCDDISIDYAIMEKANNLVAIPLSEGWSDLGDWKSVWAEMEKDENGVALSENAHEIECQDSIIRSEVNSQQIIGLGLNEIVAIAMPDAVLVASKAKTQEVKNLVESLKEKNILQAEEFLKVHRPWGWYEQIALGVGYQVKTIVVYPKASLSLQSHKFRSENWTVVEGEALVTIDKNKEKVSIGESIHIPVGSIHRLENPTEKPMTLIEVQTGSYLGEDDIIRYEDVYQRM